MSGKRSTHSPKFCQAVIGNGYDNSSQLPDQDLLYINRISAVQTDIHSVEPRPSQSVPIVRSVIQTLTLRTFQCNDRITKQPIIYHTEPVCESTPLESVSVIPCVQSQSCQSIPVIITEKQVQDRKSTRLNSSH